MQTTNTVLMIEPVAFGYNAQTAENNYFQINSENENTQLKALAEFNAFVEKLRSHGINVIVVKDTLEPHTPDSIFPNNWVSFSPEGRVVLYPMFAPNRRDERRMDIIEKLKNEGFEVKEIIDFTQSEKENKFLEGTGSIIFDQDNKIAYGSVSVRLDEDLFREFCAKIGFKPIVFHSYQTIDQKRMPIYHTNVMMCVADRYVIICTDTIDDAAERKAVVDTIEKSGKKIIEISESQMHRFAGNMLQVNNTDGDKFLVMSDTAYRSLRPDQVAAIEQYNKILHPAIPTIEHYGGGSARCMMAEIFLPKK